MLVSKLEKHLGEKVKITLFDNKIIEGRLYKSSDKLFEKNPSISLNHKYYLLKEKDDFSCLFRSSHVKKLEVEKE